MRLLLLFALATFAHAEELVPYLAGAARLHLRVPDGSPPLKNLSIPGGLAVPASWESTPERRERLTDVSFPVQWWQWKEVTLSFTPAYDGEIELLLNGPWAQEREGVLRQQEVLWDDLSAQGTTLANGGFEEHGESGPPAGWASPWRPYPAATDWPLKDAAARTGAGFGSTWHGRPLVQKLAVKSGQTVTLTLHARAATPPGFQAPKALGADTPAHRAAALLKKGVNLGNCWEAPPDGGWRIQYTLEDIDRIAAEGFDHIRVPVGWHYYFENGKIKPAFLAELEPVLRRALEKKLRVILNWHHFDELCRDPAGRREEFVKGWETIASQFKDWPQELSFELFNEPNGALDGPVMGTIYRDALKAIRTTNPDRIVLVDPSQWATVGALDRLILPDDDDRLIVSVHCYDPFQFTHQGANWVQLQDLRGVTYPGPPASPLAVPDSLKDRADLVAWIDGYNREPGDRNPCSASAVVRQLDDAVAWSKHFGRPIHLGEFGAHRLADAESRKRYSADVRRAAESRGLPWTLWDWKAGFAYWDADTGKPLLREALFAN